MSDAIRAIFLKRAVFHITSQTTCQSIDMYEYVMKLVDLVFRYKRAKCQYKKLWHNLRKEHKLRQELLTHIICPLEKEEAYVLEPLPPIPE